MSETMRINPDDGEWKFMEKNEDFSCTIKSARTKNEVTGKILSISSNGFYTIEVYKRTNLSQ